MTTGISWLALLLLLGPAAAGSGPQVDPAKTIDTVEVTAQREARRKAIQTFIANVTRFEGDQVARWRFPICPSVVGLAPDRAEFVRARIVDIARSVGAPLPREYRIDGRPVTLVLARAGDVIDAPPSSWWSKRVTRRRDAHGVNTLRWTVGGGTYVLVSELEGQGQQACFICHTDPKFQSAILRAAR